ncbi:MAG: hypothetical protein NC203_11465 [Firmicutes bacterium]|nr:hypothetical protein [Bacillota bacterium]
MKSILEDMYYRDYNLKNDSEKYRMKTGELISLIERNESDLKARLNDEELRILEKYLDCANELHMLERCSEFVSGFRLGGRIVTEMLFGAEDSELRD